MRVLFILGMSLLACGCTCVSDKTAKVGDFGALQKAVDAARPGDTVWVDGGIYFGTLKVKNSGEAGKPISIKCVPGENAVLSAADKIASKWTKYKGGIYVADVDWSAPEGRNQLLMDDEIMIEARHPNISGEKQLMEVAITPGLMTNAKAHKDKVEIEGDKFLESLPENALAGCVYWGMHWPAWASQCAKISGSKGKILSVEDKSQSGWWWVKDEKKDAKQGDGEGVLIGALALLDSPREWYYDSSAKKLYFYPPDGKDPNGLNLYFKKRAEVLYMRGVSNVIVSGINGMGGGINMLDTKNCTLENGTFKAVSHCNFFSNARGDTMFKNDNDDIAGTGVLLTGQGCVLRNLSLSYSAGSIILMDGKDHVVENNFLSDGGYMGTYRSGIFVDCKHSDATRGGHVFRNNTITRVARACIHFTSRADGKKDVPGAPYDTAYRACDILMNDFSEYLMLANDGGALNSWKVNLGSDRSARWAFNWFENCRSSELGSALYPDNYCRNVTMCRNVVRGVQEGTRINRVCENVRIYNNTFWDVKVKTTAQWKHNEGLKIYNNVSDNENWEFSKGDVHENNLTWKGDASELFELKGKGLSGFAPKRGSKLDGAGKALDKTEFPDSIGDIGAYEVGGQVWIPGVKNRRNVNPLSKN